MKTLLTTVLCGLISLFQYNTNYTPKNLIVICNDYTMRAEALKAVALFNECARRSDVNYVTGTVKFKYVDNDTISWNGITHRSKNTITINKRYLRDTDQAGRIHLYMHEMVHLLIDETKYNNMHTCTQNDIVIFDRLMYGGDEPKYYRNTVMSAIGSYYNYAPLKYKKIWQYYFDEAVGIRSTIIDENVIIDTIVETEDGFDIENGIVNKNY